MKSLWLMLIPCVALAVGCNEEPAQTVKDEEPAPPSNRIAISENVRNNLGISFVKVEKRRVARSLRVPGRFENPPTARREYRTVLAGRVELLVHQYQKIEPGTPLYRLDSPAWCRLQQELGALESGIVTAAAATEVAEATKRETEEKVELVKRRIAAYDERLVATDEHARRLKETIDGRQTEVARLEKVRATGGGRAGELAAARDKLSEAYTDNAKIREERADLKLAREAMRAEEIELRNSLPRLTAQITARKAEAGASKSKFALALNAASAHLEMKPADLLKPCPTDPKKPMWCDIGRIDVKAVAPGVVERIEATSGAWFEEAKLVLAVVDPTKIRFRATGLQSDLGRLKEGLPCRIVPPRSASIDLQDALRGTLTFGIEADPDRRTIGIIVRPERLSAWARPGVSAYLEIETDTTKEPELAVPLSCVVKDGLNHVFFRRDPADPDQVIRIEADLGLNDGRWVVVRAGVMEDDEVVLAGAYELKLTGAGKADAGGHFHADGTFHKAGGH